MNTMPSSTARRTVGLLAGVAAMLTLVAVTVNSLRTPDVPWPALAQVAHVAGRPASWDDVRKGTAAISFVYDDRHRGRRPAEGVVVPQYAYRRHAEGREPAVLIQAEYDGDGKLILGVREVASGQAVACLPENVILLGSAPR